MYAKSTLLAVMAAGLVAGALLAAAPAYAQQPRATSAETKSAKGRGAGADENIKAQRAPNQENAAVPAPPTKGGDKTRGPVSTVHADNRTNWYIDVYMDGSYCGTLAPWGDIWCYVGTGNTRMYARADFVDGSYLSWGPVVNYVDGEFVWRLRP